MKGLCARIGWQLSHLGRGEPTAWPKIRRLVSTAYGVSAGLDQRDITQSTSSFSLRITILADSFRHNGWREDRIRWIPSKDRSTRLCSCKHRLTPRLCW
jgi:hypothetical protein